MQLYTNLTRRASILGLCALAAAGCSPNPNPLGVTDTGTVVGRLVDARTAAAVGQALIQVGTQAVRIGPSDNGAFTVQNVPTGTQTVFIQAIGYQPVPPLQVIVKKGQTANISGDPAAPYQLVPTAP